RISKGYLSNVCKQCEIEQKIIRELSIKLNIIDNYYDGKCSRCCVSSTFLPVLEFHHPDPTIKESSWRKLKGRELLKILKTLQKEKVIILCRNCHTLLRAKFFLKYKDIILLENIFKQSIELLDHNLMRFIKNQPDIHEKIRKNRNYITQTKYMIKNNWLKKRYIIEELFDGKCVGCRSVNVEKNLPSLNFHHLDPSKKDIIVKWQEINHLDLKEIFKLMRKEECVCLCANCHIIIDSNRFLKNIDKILNSKKAVLFKKEINKIFKNIEMYKDK
ncbi:MAG: hypothetical protein ACFFDK_18190, partial [Promethearchaeota archaeon]